MIIPNKPVVGTMGVLVFIKAEIAAGRPFPSALQITNHFGWKSMAGTYDALDRLTMRGHLTRRRLLSTEVPPRMRGRRFVYALVDARSVT